MVKATLKWSRGGRSIQLHVISSNIPKVLTCDYGHNVDNDDDDEKNEDEEKEYKTTTDGDLMKGTTMWSWIYWAIFCDCRWNELCDAMSSKRLMYLWHGIYHRMYLCSRDRKSFTEFVHIPGGLTNEKRTTSATLVDDSFDTVTIWQHLLWILNALRHGITFEYGTTGIGTVTGTRNTCTSINQNLAWRATRDLTLKESDSIYQTTLMRHANMLYNSSDVGCR